MQTEGYETGYNTSNGSAAHDDDNINTTSSAAGVGGAPEQMLADNQIYQIIYSNLLYFTVMYLMPLTSLTYLNFKLITALKTIKMKAQMRRAATSAAAAAGVGGGGAAARSDDNNITRCVIAIVCVFIVCQTPALLNQIFYATMGDEGVPCGSFHFYYTKASDVLVVVNSSCNFVVYCLFGRTFRQIFINTIRCRGDGSPARNGSVGGKKSAVGGGGHKYRLQMDSSKSAGGQRFRPKVGEQTTMMTMAPSPKTNISHVTCANDDAAIVRC